MAVLLAASLLFGACSGGKVKAVGKKSTAELVDDLANGTDDGARVRAVVELGKRHDPVAMAALIVAVKDESERVKMTAVSGLGASRDPIAADVLFQASQDATQSRNFQVAAASALAQVGDVRAAPVLVQSLPDAPIEASKALASLGPPAIPALMAGLRDAPTRGGASRVLITMGSPAVDALAGMLRNDENKYARMAAASTLAEIVDPRATEALNEALKKPGVETVSAAYRFLIRQGQPGSEGRLIEALNVYGRSEMVEDFVASGNPALKAAAEDWARRNSSHPAMRTSDMAEVYWAGEDPGVKRLGLYHFDGSLGGTLGAGPVQSASVSFVPGKWGSALSVNQGGTLKYPLAGNLDFRDGTIEMWIAPRFDGTDPIYSKYNHALLLYHSPAGDQFLVSESTSYGFYAGSVIHRQYRGAGGGSIKTWKAGAWHHIAFTYSSRAARQRFYVDGTLTMENQGAMPVPDPKAGTFMVGCDPDGNWTGFLVDELQISTGEKTADAIQRSASRKEPFADR